DLLAVQEDISREISEKLRLRLTGEEKVRLAKRPTENIEAYQLYLKGRYYWNKRTGEGFGRAIEYFSEATEKDPSYALAHAGLASYWGNLLCFRPRRPTPKHGKWPRGLWNWMIRLARRTTRSPR